jgi:hypothetical protein
LSTYLRSSRLFRYFTRVGVQQFQCRICRNNGLTKIVQSRTYHIRQRHRSIYERERNGMSGIKEVVR